MGSVSERGHLGRHLSLASGVKRQFSRISAHWSKGMDMFWVIYLPKMSGDHPALESRDSVSLWGKGQTSFWIRIMKTMGPSRAKVGRFVCCPLGPLGGSKPWRRSACTAGTQGPAPHQPVGLGDSCCLLCSALSQEALQCVFLHGAGHISDSAVSATLDNWLGLRDRSRRPWVIRSTNKTVIAVTAQACLPDEIKIKNVLKQDGLSQRKILPAIAKHLRSGRKDKLQASSAHLQD